MTSATTDHAGIDITLDERGDTRYLLPWRQFGGRRWTGIAWILAGLSFDVWLLWNWGLHVGSLIKFVAGMFAAARGIQLVVPSRMEVKAGPAGIQWHEVGWLKTAWSRLLPWSSVTRFEIDSPMFSGGNLNKLEKAGEAHLLVINQKGERHIMVMAYSRRIVEVTVDLLQAGFERWGQATHGDDLPAVTVLDVSGIPPMSRDLQEMPTGCAISMTDTEGAATFYYRRMGIVGVILRLILITLLCLLLWGLLAAITSAILLHFFNPWVLGISLPVVGLLVVLIGIRGFSRMWTKVVIVADPNMLVVVWSSPLKQWEMSWPRQEIESIFIGHIKKGFVVSAEAWSLMVRSRGRNWRISDGRPDDWRWAATQMREILGAKNSHLAGKIDTVN